jgi:hypothetical protein
MHCCVCIGSCAHTGPHSYCAAHGGTYIQNAAPTNTTPWCVPPISRTCNHCYCLSAREHAVTVHSRCCKCGDVMADKFIPPAFSDRSEA